MTSFPFQSSISFIKSRSSWFPLFAASEINDSARSASCSTPRPNARHSASRSIASVSPRAAQSSRSAMTFWWFCGTPFHSISLLASSLTASMSPCVIGTSGSFALTVFTIIFTIISAKKALCCETEKREVSQKLFWSCERLLDSLNCCLCDSPVSAHTSSLTLIGKGKSVQHSKHTEDTMKRWNRNRKQKPPKEKEKKTKNSDAGNRTRGKHVRDAYVTNYTTSDLHFQIHLMYL